MFKHVLIPTDGSPLSESAALKGIELAHALGARVTAPHVSPGFHMRTYRTEMLEDTRDEYERDSLLHAERYLDFVAKAAAGRCRVRHRAPDRRRRLPAIIEVATDKGCDAISMASHGRRGAAGVLLGSQTQHVLTHSVTPVVVWC